MNMAVATRTRGARHRRDPQLAQPGGRRIRPAATLLVSLGTLCFVAVGGTAIHPALQSIGESLAMDAWLLGLAVGIYAMALAALVIVGGKLGDLWGQRAVVIAGLLVIGAAALLEATAVSPWMLMAGRGLRGVGAAMLLPATVAILRLGFPPARQGVALGMWGAVAVLSTGAGPLVGGAITHGLGWRWMGWISLGVVAVIALQAWRPLGGLPVPVRRQGRLDIRGMVLLTAGLLAALILATKGSQWGYLSPATMGTLAVATACGALLIVVERRATQPLLHPDVLRSPHFVAGLVGGVVSVAMMVGVLYFFCLFVQSGDTWGYSPLAASVAVLPFAVSAFAMSMLAGGLYARFGYGWPVMVGLAMSGAGAIGLATSVAHGTYVDVLVPLMVVGLGVGLSMAGPIAVAMGAVGPDRAGEVSGLLNGCRYLGVALFIAVGTTVFTDVSETKLNTALQQAGVSPTDMVQLDSALTDSASHIASIEHHLGLSAIADDAFRDGALRGITSGYSATMTAIGVVALVAAAIWPVLIRRTHRSTRHLGASQDEQMPPMSSDNRRS